MKNTTFPNLKLAFLLAFSLTALTAFPQDAKQRKQITKNYDIRKLNALQQELAAQAKLEKEQALAAAKLNGWPVFRKNDNGTFDELMSVSNDGKPVYYSLDNVNAAKSTRANHLNSGGSLGLSLDGQGMFSGVWDGGSVRTTHQEFGGRMTVGDGITAITDNSFHATHVTGTVGASGVQANAKGMAPQSTVHTYDWNNDAAEVTAEAANGLLLSNHSYGTPVASSQSWTIGAYTAASRNWDQIAYNAPYYLMVASAGNDGNANNPSPMTSGYDKLTGNKVCKNNLVVANCQDATVDAQGNLISVSINSSSSEGPADDRRIKPDITGNGSGLTSTTSTSNTSYGSLSGTSMASPNVMGTLLLVQQHYNNLNGRFMRAATLKGLACHTADDRGKTGPDPVWGWGLLNAKKAAQAISQNGFQSWISEQTLQQGETFTFTAQSDGVNPLLASISWTDVPGVGVNNVLNGLTPALVNDLDIRITKDGVTYYPWKLQNDANLAAINSEDNSVDNVERINIAAAAGTYTITVSHKGTLQNGPQDFSFVVTGLSSGFSMIPLSEEQTACLDGTATYHFNFANSDSTPTVFSATGLPTGAVAAFSPAALSASGSFTMTVSNLQNAIPGQYQIGVIGNNGSETETRLVPLKVSSADFLSVVPTSPANAQTGMATNLQLVWNAVENADSFHVQVAADANFSTIVSEGNTSENLYNVTGLNESTFYYWRVFPINSCGEGANASVSSFQTGQLVCNNHFEPTDYSNGIINDQGPGFAIIQIPVTGDLTVGDLNITLNLTHSNLGDITVDLEGPAAIGFPRMTLLSEPCVDSQNIACVIDDAGTNTVCNATTPGITGTVRPFQSLGIFSNKPANGTWTIYVSDPYIGDGGAVTFASLDFCTVQPDLSVRQHILDSFSVYPNPSKGILNVKHNGTPDGNTNLVLYDMQGRNMMAKQNISTSETLDIEHLQSGVYLLSIENGTQKTTKKIVLNK